jgi:hypothetical protein
MQQAPRCSTWRPTPLDSPAAVASALTAAATRGEIKNVGTASPNLLVFTGDAATVQPPLVHARRQVRNCK